MGRRVRGQGPRLDAGGVHSGSAAKPLGAIGGSRPEAGVKGAGRRFCFENCQVIEEEGPTPVPARVSPTDRVRAKIDELFASDRELPEILEEVARLGAQLLMQAALEAEVTEFLGRDRYQRTAATPDAQSGARNGYRPVTVKTTAGQTLMADKNYYGRQFEAALADAGIELLRPRLVGADPAVLVAVVVRAEANRLILAMTPPPEARNSFVVTRNTTASRQQVWDVIADGWTYSQWVVGNSRMRAVDPSWPSPGQHHPPLDRRVARSPQRRNGRRRLRTTAGTRSACQGSSFRGCANHAAAQCCRRRLSYRDVRGAGESPFEMVAPLGRTGRSVASKSRMHLAAGRACRTPQA